MLLNTHNLYICAGYSNRGEGLLKFVPCSFTVCPRPLGFTVFEEERLSFRIRLCRMLCLNRKGYILTYNVFFITLFLSTACPRSIDPFYLVYTMVYDFLNLKYILRWWAVKQVIFFNFDTFFYVYKSLQKRRVGPIWYFNMLYLTRALCRM